MNKENCAHVSDFAKRLQAGISNYHIMEVKHDIAGLEISYAFTNIEKSVFHRLQLIGINIINTAKTTPAHQEFLKKIEGIYKDLSIGEKVNTQYIENALKVHQHEFTLEISKKLNQLKEDNKEYSQGQKLSLENCGDLTINNISELITKKTKQCREIRGILDPIYRFGLTDLQNIPSEQDMEDTLSKLKEEINVLELAQTKIKGTMTLIDDYKNKHSILSKFNLRPLVNEISELKAPTLNSLQKIGQEEINSK